MNKPFVPCLVQRVTPIAPEAPAATPKGSIYTPPVKNRQRSRVTGAPAGRFTLAAASLVLAMLAPGAALADAPSGLEKLQAIAKQAQEKSGKPGAAKGGKDKGAQGKAGKGEKKEPTVEERALRGVVAIERSGQVLSMGAALAGDGRILTALSPLGLGNDLEARFADGTTVRVKLGHHDREWDLAFLVPQTGKWQEGLTASSREPIREDATIRSFSLTRGKPVPVSMTLRGYRALLGGDDRVLEQAIELGSRVLPADLGAPIIDEEGRVVAVIGRGCARNEGRACTPVAFGVPMTAVKSFLRSVPPTAVPPPAWLGIQGVAEAGAVAKGVRITVVHPESPAHEAQLKGGDRAVSDMILAVDGVPVTSPEALADAMRTHGIGEKVPLTIFSQGKYKQVTVTLRAAPGSRSAASAAPAHPAELPPLPDSTPSPAPGPSKRPTR